MADISGGFLAFCHGQFCEGWRRHMLTGMAGFWLSSMARHLPSTALITRLRCTSLFVSFQLKDKTSLKLITKIENAYI
jgi:hypothetical protein